MAQGPLDSRAVEGSRSSVSGALRRALEITSQSSCRRTEPLSSNAWTVSAFRNPYAKSSSTPRSCTTGTKSRRHSLTHRRVVTRRAVTMAAPGTGACWHRSCWRPRKAIAALSGKRRIWPRNPTMALQRQRTTSGSPCLRGSKSWAASSWLVRDGRFLGSQWLLMKVSDERLDRARHRRSGNQLDHLLRDVDLIEWIARGLFGAGLTNDQIAPFVDVPDISAPGDLAPPFPRHVATIRSRLALLHLP